MLQLPPKLSGGRISNMYERHHQMARLLLLGMTAEEVAKAVGCSPSSVANIKSSPIFQQKLQYLKHQADSRAVDVAVVLAKNAYKSLDILEKVRDGQLTDDIRLRTRVAQDLLDRAGHGKITRVEGHHSFTHLGTEALDRIKDMSRSIREARYAQDPNMVEAA